MKAISSSPNTFFNLDILSIGMLLLSLSLLSIMALNGSLTPILLFMLMIGLAYILIVLFSKDAILDKVKLFIFFFSFYLFYIMMHDYILLTLSPNRSPFDYVDESTFYHYSEIALYYILGGKNFFDIFSDWNLPFRDLPLHTSFSVVIAYFSKIIDGNNTIMVQKLLSPFFGGILSVVLYSTLKYQFKDRIFALNATFAYGLLSSVFMYSTPLLRDIDIALAYMIVIYLFLQKNSFINVLLMFLVAFCTMYLRIESGMVLFIFVLLSSYLHVRSIESKSVKFIFYIFIIIIFFIVIFLMYGRVIGMIVSLNEINTARVIAQSPSGSVASIFRKFPFPMDYVAKVLFGQMQPFPFFLAMDRPAEAISGIFWPFIFIIMIYAMMKKNIRILIDIKVKFLLIVAIAILFLMSSEPMARRMMSIYPIIYITSLYVFFIIPNNKIKRFFSYYLFTILSLNLFYYLMKL